METILDCRKMLIVDTQADCTTDTFPAWQREIFSPEAVTQCLIHKCKGQIFAQIREDGRWIWYNPNKHEGYEECARAVYIVSGQVINRDGGAEVLGVQYSPKASDHKTYEKCKCKYFKIICCLNAQDERLHVATCFAERFKPRVDTPQHSISGSEMFRHARDTVFVNYQAGSAMETHESCQRSQATPNWYYGTAIDAFSH